MKHYALSDFEGIDSLYRLVYIAAKRVAQVSKPEGRALVPTRSQKPTIVALEEVLNDKVGYKTGDAEADEFEIV